MGLVIGLKSKGYRAYKRLRKYLKGILFMQTFRKISYSQEGEDILLNRIIGDNKDRGFFIDIGAHHPVKFSNTFFLYKKGWHGINIDAMPGSMRKFRRIRRRDLNLEIPIAAEKQQLTYYIFNYPEVNTFVKSHAEEWDGKGDVKIVDRKLLTTSTLTELLSSYVGDRRVDLMSIDVEGMDFEILQTLDLQRYQVDLIVIEEGHKNIEEILKGEIYRYLSNNGYELISKLWNSTIYRRSA